MKEIIQEESTFNNQIEISFLKEKKYSTIAMGINESVTEEDFKNQMVKIFNFKEEEIDITKSFKSKNGKVNIILKANKKISDKLQDNSCFISFNRVVFKRYVKINRCFRCQRFGHVQSFCKKDACCARCGQRHDTRSCSSERYKCINCNSTEHRADSPSCQAFKDFKNNEIKRLTQKL